MQRIPVGISIRKSYVTCWDPRKHRKWLSSLYFTALTLVQDPNRSAKSVLTTFESCRKYIQKLRVCYVEENVTTWQVLSLKRQLAWVEEILNDWWSRKNSFKFEVDESLETFTAQSSKRKIITIIKVIYPKDKMKENKDFLWFPIVCIGFFKFFKEIN